MYSVKVLRGALFAVFAFGLALAATTLAGGGKLTQKAPPNGCVSAHGYAGCVKGRGLVRAFSVVVSPDGANAYAASLGNSAVAVFDRDKATGALTQKRGVSGCISNNGNHGCFDGRALKGALSVTVSQDGKNVYVVSGDLGGAQGVAVFDRNPRNGKLTQKEGSEGCITDDGKPAGCADGKALFFASTMAISPDGTNAYVAASGAGIVHGVEVSGSIAIFDRDKHTGVLTQKSAHAGCISENGTGGTCAEGVALDGAGAVTVSPDGANVYLAASENSNAVAIFDRDGDTGNLTQKPGAAGCISNDGTGGECVDGNALRYPNSIVVSPDGANAYVVSYGSGAVSIFNRNENTGALKQKPGTAGCVANKGDREGCLDGELLDGAISVAISPDGAGVYVAATNRDSLTIFNRSSNTGALAQKSGRSGCISRKGSKGACANGAGLREPRNVTISPDGDNAYVASQRSNAVAVFDRVRPQTPRGHRSQR